MKLAEDGDHSDFPEKFRFQVFTVWFLLSMLLKLILCVTFVSTPFSYETASGAIIQIEFLSIILSEGTGVILVMLFGFTDELQDQLKDLVVSAHMSFRKMIYGVEDVDLDRSHQLSLQLARLLLTLKDGRTLSGDFLFMPKRRSGLRVYKNVGVGTEIIDFLLRTQHATTREDAVHLGSQLWLANALDHVVHEHTFQDKPYFYCLDPAAVVEAEAMCAAGRGQRRESVVVGAERETRSRTMSALAVTVVNAKGLQRMDTFGSCNPFCSLRIETNGEEMSKAVETKVCKQRINPSWQQTLEVKLDTVPAGEMDNSVLCVAIYHRELVRRTPMGKVSLSMADLRVALGGGKEISGWHSLQHLAGGDENPKGRLFLTIAPVWPFGDTDVGQQLRDLLQLPMLISSERRVSTTGRRQAVVQEILDLVHEEDLRSAVAGAKGEATPQAAAQQATPQQDSAPQDSAAPPSQQQEDSVAAQQDDSAAQQQDNAEQPPESAAPGSPGQFSGDEISVQGAEMLADDAPSPMAVQRGAA